ncbi:proteinase-activated receptor 3-like [Callorhinchus milii]|uniref:proteinase-activated receptor 3-like n=1 Tax=Callorhinchus milii TaxID=7868 RepID=UPI001C3F58FA|nr:proteinase-activated receptor 3-like [Callorhinchus milii]
MLEVGGKCAIMNNPHLLQTLLFSLLISSAYGDGDGNTTTDIVETIKYFIIHESSLITFKNLSVNELENMTDYVWKNLTIYKVDNITRGHLTGAVTTVFIPTLYILVFGIGLPANALGLWIMITKIRKLPSTIFLINLATSDLLLILMLPFKISYHLMGNDWIFGEALCRLYTGLFYGNIYCSILLLTFISVDRYFALVHPFLSLGFRDKRLACGVCLGTWALVSLSLLPFLLVQQTYHIHNLNVTTCHDSLLSEQRSGYFFYYFASLVIVEFALPCAITLFCYGSIIKTLAFNEKKYKRAAGATTLTLLVYVLCFTPSNVILLTHHLQFFLNHHSDLYIYYMLSLALSGFSSCLDPFIYYFVSDDFRAKVQATLCSRKEKGGRETSPKVLRVKPPINTVPLTSSFTSTATAAAAPQLLNSLET